MKIITGAGIVIKEEEIDVEYAKAIIRAMLSRIAKGCAFREEALKELERVERYVTREKDLLPEDPIDPN